MLQIRSGPSVEESRDFFSGAKGYLDEVRDTARGKLRVVTRTVEDDPAQLTAAMRELATQQRVDVILGLVREAQLDLALADPVLQGEQVVFVAPTVGSHKYEANARVLLLRAGYEDEAQFIGQSLKTMGVTRMVIALPEAMKLDAELMQAAIQRATGHAPHIVLSTPGAAGGSAHLAQVTAKSPQAIVVAGDSVDYATFYQAYRKAVPGTFIIGLSKVNPRSVLQILGGDASGAIITQVAEDPRRQVTLLAREHSRIMRKYFDEPASAATFEGHMAARWLAQWASERRGGRVVEQLRELRTEARRMELDGLALSFGGAQKRASRFVDLVMLRANGSLTN
ncbi:MAG: ABC transporter substrate-binding protein [Burkholderiaceae bacterium]